MTLSSSSAKLKAMTSLAYRAHYLPHFLQEPRCFARNALYRCHPPCRNHLFDLLQLWHIDGLLAIGPFMHQQEVIGCRSANWYATASAASIELGGIRGLGVG